MSPYFKRITLTLLLPLTVLAQLGDKKDEQGQEQIDPVPAEIIPPAPFLSIAEALSSFQIADGFTIEPVAWEPLVENPVAISFDPNGRMWVAEMRSYMPDIDGNGEDTPNGRIRILEDTDGDGQMDKSTDFLDDLVLPRLVSLAYGGVIFNDGDALYFIERSGLRPKGKRQLIDAGYAKGGNPEHKANGMLYGHDNWYYNAKSSSRYRRVDGKWIKENTVNRGQFGITKDNTGRLFHNSNSTLLVGDAFTPGFIDPMPANRIGTNAVYSSRINPGVNRAYREGTLDDTGKLVNATAASGPTFYRGDNFPKEFQNYVFTGETSANLVKAIEIQGFENFEHTGRHPYGEKEFLTSTDERFRPVNMFTAPDGSLFIADMYHGLIQHKAYVTTYLRKQYKSRSLDKHNNDAGRIYRVRWTDTPLNKIPKLEGLPPTELTPYLAHPNGFWRDTAQRLLVELGDTSIAPLLAEIAGDVSVPLGQIHALWTLEGLNKVDGSTIRSALRSNEPGVVRTAFEVAPLCDSESRAIAIEAVMQKEDPEHVYKARSLTRLAGKMAWNALYDILDQQPDALLLNDTVLTALNGNYDDFKKFLTSRGSETGARFLNTITEAQQASFAKANPAVNQLSGKAEAAFQRGKLVYESKAACLGCHNLNGEGLLNLGPPLAESDWVTGDPDRLIKILLHGLEGPVTVSGKTYSPDAVMPGLAANPTISDKDLADVLTYIRNAWGNAAAPVKEKQVASIRKETRSRGERLYKAEDFD